VEHEIDANPVELFDREVAVNWADSDGSISLTKFAVVVHLECNEEVASFEIF